MGNRGGTAEVTRRQATAWLTSYFGRRTTLRVWCGVIFCTLGAGCSAPAQESAPPAKTLTIGFAEGGTASERLGQLTTIFTLEGLTQLAVDGRPLPRLARQWAWENNFRHLRLYLQPNVTFHDGTPLTSTVAADALRVAMERNLAFYPSFSDVTRVRPDGDAQLVLELSQPSAFLPEALDLPLTVGDANVGTGPFRIVETGAHGAMLRRFDEYYLGAPAIEEIVIRPYTLRTAWTSLLRGDVDMVTEVPPQTVEFVQNEEIEVVSFARRYQFLVAFNSARAPFTSPSVRRALNIAVDREHLIARALHGRGEAASGPLWPKHWAYDRSLKGYGFDPQVAASLLESAGFRLKSDSVGRPPARLRFTCLIAEGFPLLERIGLEIQKQLYDVGVDMEFETVSFQQYDTRIRAGRFDAVLVDLISGPTFERPFMFWRSAKDSQFLNVFGYENADAERAFQALRRATNEASVRTAANRLQRVLLEDPPALFLMWNERARAVRRNFQRVGEPDRDPLYTIWQWTENTNSVPQLTAQ